MATTSSQIKMCIAGRRINGYSDEKFIHEFSVVHAGITKASAQKTPAMLGYRQVLGIPRPKIPIFNNIHTNQPSWDSQAILVWSSIDDLSALLKSEEYRVNAGRHIFTEPPRLASICKVAGEITFDDDDGNNNQEGAPLFMMFVYIPRAAAEEAGRKSDQEEESPGVTITEQEVTQRVEAITKIGGTGTGLLKYTINRDVGPPNPQEVFAGTPFANCQWGAIGVTEQYWFKDEDAAVEFFADEQVAEVLLGKLPVSLDGQGCIGISGIETVLVDKGQV